MLYKSPHLLSSLVQHQTVSESHDEDARAQNETSLTGEGFATSGCSAFEVTGLVSTAVSVAQSVEHRSVDYPIWF
jgi:hypothetical protein